MFTIHETCLERKKKSELANFTQQTLIQTDLTQSPKGTYLHQEFPPKCQ